MTRGRTDQEPPSRRRRGLDRVRSGLARLRESVPRPGRWRRGPATPRAHPGGYPGDFTGTSTVAYRPETGDGVPDPGEVVWTWVPFEEDTSMGKDRPVLVVGYDEHYPLALMLTSQDHDEKHARESDRRNHRDFVDIGTGAWDSHRRPSEVRTDRVIRLDPDAIRREGGVLARERFDEVAAHLRSNCGWR